MKILTDHFVEGWRSWHKWASMRLGAFASLVGGFIVASPQTLIDTINAMPDDIRHMLPAFVTVGAFALIFLTRVWATKKPCPPAADGDVAA